MKLEEDVALSMDMEAKVSPPRTVLLPYSYVLRDSVLLLPSRAAVVWGALERSTCL